MENLKLNYQELAFLMALPVKESKELYARYLDKDKISKNDLISVEELKPSFKKVTSVDDRFHGANELELTLSMAKNRYKKHLNDLPSIKKKDFTGGKTVFIKILSNEELKHAREQFKYKYDYLGFNKKD
jgi:hypothetical protein